MSPLTLRVVLSMLVNWQLSEQCWWGGGQRTTTMDPMEPISNHGVGQKAHKPKDMWNGWQPPPGMPNFTTYVAAYNKRLENIRKKKGLYGAQYPKGMGPGMPGSPGWPKGWVGVGPGNDGNPPPPWSYVPVNTGKPKFCFDQPISGDCPDGYPKTRYGYNPFMDECQEFDFVCRGNQNNFKTREKCEEMCMGASESACDTQGLGTIDDHLG
ncbi:uncharacterized protein LOC126379601 [Pectinophora gossypiella]|uniref:uncharacterized protein LOC126379601 n=1 Tax=Pectinophora gossypiella TaxID=13191 RepID=UPI00214F4C42|nr:uncharacterized protein LOC126379601 [Pectinophora gossypiella]XP_049884377.1 uncharacterized protein LOC126379601 [Pectinophora gossypiella]XP_049884378.1 uncharacterized protein LOC126379601 [Pectinophora gossypiella]